MTVFLFIFLIILELGLIIFDLIQKFSKKTKTKKRIIIKVSELAVFLAIVFLAIMLFRTYIITDYKGREVTGPYKVAEANAILIDTSRVEEFEDDGSFREVPVHFFYPEEADEEMPLSATVHSATIRATHRCLWNLQVMALWWQVSSIRITQFSHTIQRVKQSSLTDSF